MDITFLQFGDAEKQQLVDEYSFFRPAAIPADTYRNQTEPFNGLDVGSMHLITSTDTPEELVYTVTRLLYENRELVVEKHAAGRAINPNNVVRDTGTEFHPAARCQFERTPPTTPIFGTSVSGASASNRFGISEATAGCRG